jgi:hypothetical protein
VSGEGEGQAWNAAYKLKKTRTANKTVIHAPELVLVSQYEIMIDAAVISAGTMIEYVYQ